MHSAAGSHMRLHSEEFQMRLIDADKAEQILRDMAKDGHNQNAMTSWANALDDFAEMISEAPTIEAEPVRHGKWIVEAEDWRHQIEWVKCSQCDFPTFTAYKYCPNCGALMEIKNDSN